MKKIWLALLLVILLALPVKANLDPRKNYKGMTVLRSSFTVEQTSDRLETLLSKRGLNLFAKIDHQAGATSVGKNLRPTKLFIFGNPKVGTPLMQCQQTVAIDLPQKMLVWEDRFRWVWIGYNSPAYLKKRHDINGCDRIINKIEKALSNLAKSAAKNN